MFARARTRFAVRSFRCTALSLAVTPLLSTLPAHAATDTWTGLSSVPTNNWSDTGNWNPGSPLPGDSILFDGFSQLSTNNDLTGLTVNGLSFASTAGNFILTGNGITLNGNIIDNSTTVQTLSLPVLLAANSNISVIKNGNLAITSALSDNSSGFGITLTGAGNLTLSGANTYSGGTNIGLGTVVLDYNAAGAAPSILNSASTLVMTGHGTFKVNGNAATAGSQAVNGVTLNAATSSVIAVTNNGAAQNLDLGAISRGTNAAVDFEVAAGSTLTTTTANTNASIMGPYYTMNGGWAVSAGTGSTAGQITPLATYDTAFTAGSNEDVTGTISGPASALALNSLRISAATASTLTLAGALNVSSGGILNTNAGNTITGGNITTSSGELVITNRAVNTSLIVASPITGNVNVVIVNATTDAFGTHADSGVVFGNTTSAQNFIGNITIVSGRLSSNNTNQLGNANNTLILKGDLNGGGQFFDNNVAIAATHTIIASGLGFAETNGASYGAIRARNTISAPIIIAGTTRIGASSNGTLVGKISGAFDLWLDVDTGVSLILSNANNTWSGETRIERGLIKMGVVNGLPQSTIVNFGSLMLSSQAYAPRGSVAPTLDIAGFNTTIGGALVTADPALSSDIITNSGAAATLTVNSVTPTTFSGSIQNVTNALNLTKTGAATFTITGSNSYTGNTTVSQGTLSLGATGSINSSANILVAANGTLDASANPSGLSIGGTQALISNGVVLGNVSSSATLAGTGTLGNVTSSANIHPGASAADASVGTLNIANLTVNAGDLRIDATGGSSDKLLISGTANFNGGSTVTVVPGSLTGTYTILSAATLNAGQPLSAGGNAPGVEPTLSQTTVGRSSFSLSFTDTTITLSVLGNPFSLTWNNTGGSPADGATWDIQTNQNWHTASASDFYFEGDNVTFNDNNNGNYNVTISGTVNPGSVTVANNNGNYLFSGGSIAGATSINKTGSGTLTLNSFNSYSGGTTLGNGTLNIGNASALGNGTLTLTNGTLDNTTGAALTLANTINLNGNITLPGAADGSHDITTAAVNLTANSTLTINAGNVTIPAAINGAFSLTKAGAGLLSLSAANSYTGGTNITGGVLFISNAGALGTTGPLTITGGTFDMSGLTTTNSLNLGSRLISIQGAGVPTVAFSNGEGAVINAGVGQFNAFEQVVLTGDATINASTGRIDIGRNGSGNFLNLQGHTLTKIGASQLTITGAGAAAPAILGPGNILVSQGTLSIEEAVTSDANVTVTYLDGTVASFFATTGALQNQIVVGNNAANQTVGVIMGNTSTGSATIPSNITLRGNLTLEPIAAGTLSTAGVFPATFSGSIAEAGGSYSVSKDGPATTITLSGNNSWSGGTNLRAGTLALRSNTALPAGTALNYSDTNNDAATLDLAGFNASVGALNAAGAGTLTIGSSSVTAPSTFTFSSGTSSFAGTIQDILGSGNQTVALNVASGNLTLSGANTYSGGTSVSGSLIAANVQALGKGGVAIHTGGTLQLQPSLATAVEVPSLTFDGTTGNWTGSLDITNNKLIVEDAVTHATSVANLQSQAHSVITASGVPANYGVAVIDNGALTTPFGSFGGVFVDTNSILIAPELLGDANIDGTVDINDLNTVLSHFGASTGAWTNGNFDGAPTIDLTDLAAVLNNFGLTNSSPSVSIATPTPEPASLALLALAAPALLTRRRKH